MKKSLNMLEGNIVGKEALAAVGGSTGTVINLLVGFVVGLASGATVVIAQYYGNHELEGVEKGVYSSMLLAIVLGAVLTILGIAFTPWILDLLKVPEDIMDYSITYMRIFLVGMIPSLIYILYYKHCFRHCICYFLSLGRCWCSNRNNNCTSCICTSYIKSSFIYYRFLCISPIKINI